MAAPKTTIKLVVDKEDKTVLFAEAKKDFVDFLFQILTLPIGAIIKLSQMNEIPGCLSDLYRSIQSLKGEHLQPNANKDALLDPKPTVNVPLLSIQGAQGNHQFYRCSRNGPRDCFGNYVTNDPSTKCSLCGFPMSVPVNLASTSTHKLTLSLRIPLPSRGTINSGTISEGYAKTESIYLVMDNLEVHSISTVSTVALLKDLNVKDVGSLIYKEVEVGLTEGLAILKASLQTRVVLTSVFLGKKVKVKKEKVHILE